jgi:carboxyl-terminal processing protease
MPHSVKVAFLVVGGLVAALLLIAGGFLLGISPDVGGAVRDLSPDVVADGSSSEDFALQKEVFDRLDQTFYRPVDPDVLEQAAIDGMVAGLEDPYTVYLDPEEYAAFRADTAGSYSGVGMVVEMKDKLVTIVSTFKGSPAEQAGITSGDIILAVDGESVAGKSLDEVVGAIKGEEGTTVVLDIYRPLLTTTTTTETSGSTGTTATTEAGEADISNLPVGGVTTTYTLTRKTIAIPVTETEVLRAADGKKVAHVQFFTFSQGSAAKLRSEVQKAVEVDKVDAIILDLRSNGGGLLDEAVAVASIFIPSGVIVSTEGLHSPEQVYEASGQAYAAVPLYVLTDPYTASASEIVAGALQDHQRATLLGETTFGKGLVQSISGLSNSGALKVTTAVYLTPNGRDINQTGITPDVVAPDDPLTDEVDETVEAALKLIAGGSPVAGGAD